MILFLLISTFIVSFLIIKAANYSKDYFFNLPLLVITPPLFGSIYSSILLKFGILTEDVSSLINPIFDELSIIFIKSLLCLSLMVFLVRKFLPPLVIPKTLNFPNVSSLLVVYLFFCLLEIVGYELGLSVHLMILVGEITNLSFILLISSLIINLKINNSFLKFASIATITIITIFTFTFDKGITVGLFCAVFLVLLGSKNLNIKLNLLKTNILIIAGGIRIPFLNFIEQGFLLVNTKGDAYKSLLEVMESNGLFINYYHVFYNPACLYNHQISIFESIISPFKAILGMAVSFHSDVYMDTCFPIAKLNGAGLTFGLINESALQKELPPFLFFSLVTISFILILEFLYYRFSLFGLLVYAQSIEIIYKLTRNSFSASIYFLLYTIIASFIVIQTVKLVDYFFSSKKFIL